MSSDQTPNWQCPHGYIYTGSELDRKLCSQDHPRALMRTEPDSASPPQQKRLSRPALFMQVAELFGQRSSCPRANVGAVAVKDRRIVATGYVGAPSGLPHCNEAGCELGPDGGCTRTIHAEANLVAWAARTGTSLEGSVIYCTHQPCLNCAKLIANVGVQAMVWKNPYRSDDGANLLYEMSIPVYFISMSHQELDQILHES